MDQRCHGRSLGIMEDCENSTVGASANDLSRFLEDKLGGRKLEFLAGHSLGGKVVLDLLQNSQSNPPTQQVGKLSHMFDLTCKTSAPSRLMDWFASKAQYMSVWSKLLLIEK